jgi:hypothetical protein
MNEDFALNIKVNDGDLFEGSLDQWEDCFFAFPFHFSLNDKLEQIQNYCSGYNYNLTFSFKSKEDQKIKLIIK